MLVALHFIISHSLRMPAGASAGRESSVPATPQQVAAPPPTAGIPASPAIALTPQLRPAGGRVPADSANSGGGANKVSFADIPRTTAATAGGAMKVCVCL